MLNAFNLKEEMLSVFVPTESKIKSLLFRVMGAMGSDLGPLASRLGTAKAYD